MFFLVLAENLKGIDGHRTVHVNPQDGYLIFQLELTQDVKQLLSTAYCKRRNHDRPSTLGGRRHHVAKLILAAAAVLVAVQTIAIGALENEVISGLHR